MPPKPRHLAYERLIYATNNQGVSVHDDHKTTIVGARTLVRVKGEDVQTRVSEVIKVDSEISLTMYARAVLSRNRDKPI